MKSQLWLLRAPKAIQLKIDTRHQISVFCCCHGQKVKAQTAAKGPATYGVAFPRILALFLRRPLGKTRRRRRSSMQSRIRVEGAISQKRALLAAFRDLHGVLNHMQGKNPGQQQDETCFKTALKSL